MLFPTSKPPDGRTTLQLNQNDSRQLDNGQKDDHCNSCVVAAPSAELTVDNCTAMPARSLLILLSFLLAGVAHGFVQPKPASSLQQQRHQMALFDDEDTSTFDALVRFGPAPFMIRLLQPDKYEAGVQKFMKEEGCSRVVAHRNMDAYFLDPNGWVVARDRATRRGEVTPDYTGQSAVQRRPVFSFFWAIFVFWFFLSFIPTRVTELGGINPHALSGGFCTPDVRVVDDHGREQFYCSKPGAM